MNFKHKAKFDNKKREEIQWKEYNNTVSLWNRNSFNYMYLILVVRSVTLSTA